MNLKTISKFIIAILIAYIGLSCSVVEKLGITKKEKKGLSAPSNLHDARIIGEIYAMAMDEEFLYIAGLGGPPHIGTTGRVEKRSKESGALITSFGDQGAINPLMTTRAILTDEMYLYIGGSGVSISSGFSTDTSWRLQKRDRETGSLIKEFGQDGIITLNPTDQSDSITSMAIYDSYIFIAGGKTWRLEKRDKTTGKLDENFGEGGVIENGYNLYSSYKLFVYGQHIYIGSNASPVGVERRTITNGELDKGFGASGILSTEYGIEILFANENHIIIGGIYYENKWIIEKLLTEDGNKEFNFGVNGQKISNSSSGSGSSKLDVSIDNNDIYIAGDESSDTDTHWRIEKRDQETGQLIQEFGKNGVVTSDKDGLGNDRPSSIIYDNGYIFIAGREEVGLSGEFPTDYWKLEKRDATSGALIPEFGQEGVILTDKK